MAGYTKQRSNWLDYPTTSTPILATNLNGLETAIYNIKHDNLADMAADYGADNTGVADCTAATNAALSDVAAGTAGAGIYFGPGTFKHLTAISVPTNSAKGITIAGAGMGQTQLTFTGVGHLFTIGGTSNADPAYGQWIEDMTIQCTYVASAILGAAKFRAATWCGIRRCRISGSNLGSQIHVDFEGGAYYSFYNTVEGNDFRGIDQPTDIGIRLKATTADGANANWIRRNFFSTYNRAVLVASGDENFINENHFGSFVNTGVRLDNSGTGNANGNQVIQNQFDGVVTTAVDVGAGSVDTMVHHGYSTVTAYINNGANTRQTDNVGSVWTGSGTFVGFQAVASAATITIPEGATLVSITGTTNITSITASWPGREITLLFAGVLTFTNGSNLKLAGAANFVTTASDTINLVCDGTNWYELSRAVD